MKANKKLGYIIVIISAVLYGLMPLVTKTVYASGANSFTAAFLRMCIGVIVFFALFKATSKEAISIDRNQFLQILICAACYGFTPVLLFTSYNYLASGLATTLHFVYPVFVVLGSAIFKIGKLTKRKIICCFLCMAGIVAFYTPGGEISVLGIVIALASGVVYAAYTVYLEASDLLDMNACKLSFWKHLLAMVMVGVVAFAFKKIAWPGTGNGWMFGLLLGLLTAASSFLYQQGAKFAGAQDTALLSTFEPLTSVFVGYFVYSEPMTIRNVIGIICILLSVALLSTDGRKTKK